MRGKILNSPTGSGHIFSFLFGTSPCGLRSLCPVGGDDDGIAIRYLSTGTSSAYKYCAWARPVFHNLQLTDNCPVRGGELGDDLVLDVEFALSLLFETPQNQRRLVCLVCVFFLFSNVIDRLLRVGAL